jgi:hypothetical protein
MMAGPTILTRDMGAISMATILRNSAPVLFWMALPYHLRLSRVMAALTVVLSSSLSWPTLCWSVIAGPVDGLTVQDLTDSIPLATASCTIVCGPFLALLRESAPGFQAWLDAIQTNPGAFQVDSFYYQYVEHLFPDLAGSKELKAIVNLAGFRH